MSIQVEHLVRWESLTDTEKELLIAGLKSNDLSPLTSRWVVEMPCLFTVLFPLELVNPQHPPQALGQIQIRVEPKVAETQLLSAPSPTDRVID